MRTSIRARRTPAAVLRLLLTTWRHSPHASLRQFGPFGVSGGNPTPTPVSAAMTPSITGCPGVQFGPVTRTLGTDVHVYDFYGRTDVQWRNDTLVGRYLYNKSTFFNLN